MAEFPPPKPEFEIDVAFRVCDFAVRQQTRIDSLSLDEAISFGVAVKHQSGRITWEWGDHQQSAREVLCLVDAGRRAELSAIIEDLEPRHGTAPTVEAMRRRYEKIASRAENLISRGIVPAHWDEMNLRDLEGISIVQPRGEDPERN